MSSSPSENNPITKDFIKNLATTNGFSNMEDYMVHYFQQMMLNSNNIAPLGTPSGESTRIINRGISCGDQFVAKYKDIPHLSPNTGGQWQDMFSEIWKHFPGLKDYVLTSDTVPPIYVDEEAYYYPNNKYFANEIIFKLKLHLMLKCTILGDTSSLRLIYQGVQNFALNDTSVIKKLQEVTDFLIKSGRNGNPTSAIKDINKINSDAKAKNIMQFLELLPLTEFLIMNRVAHFSGNSALYFKYLKLSYDAFASSSTKPKTSAIDIWNECELDPAFKRPTEKSDKKNGNFKHSPPNNKQGPNSNAKPTTQQTTQVSLSTKSNE